MAQVPVTHDERNLEADTVEVAESYKEVGQQIERLKDLNVSQKLDEFLVQFHEERNEAIVYISNVVRQAADLYRSVENEAKAHVMRAKSFAKQNIAAVKKVHEKRCVPEEAFYNFMEMGEHLTQSCTNLIKAHQDVLNGLKEAERKVQREKESWCKSKSNADKVYKATIPIFGAGYTADLVANKAAATVDNSDGKTALRILGGFAGFLGGLIASVLLLPVITSAALKARYGSWENEFGEMQDSLDEVDNIISAHRDTLIDIRNKTETLYWKHEALKDRLSSKKSVTLALDTILHSSEDLKKTCEEYLEKVITRTTSSLPRDLAKRMKALDVNPVLPIQSSSSDEAEISEQGKTYKP